MTPEELEDLLTEKKETAIPAPVYRTERRGREPMPTVAPSNAHLSSIDWSRFSSSPRENFIPDYRRREFLSIRQHSEIAREEQRRTWFEEDEDEETFPTRELLENVKRVVQRILADIANPSRGDTEFVIVRALISQLSQTFTDPHVEIIRNHIEYSRYDLRITLAWFGRTKLLEFPLYGF